MDLAEAAANGYNGMISLLLDRGADVNMVCDGEYGSALAAAGRNGKYSTVSLLLDRGADVNMACGGRYGSALAAAARGKGNSDVSLVLDRGADVNMAYGETYGSALAAFESQQNNTIVELLLERGADVNMECGGRYGSALAAAAARYGAGPTVSLLLDQGADVNMACGGEYGSALAAAAYSGGESTVSLLLDRGADVNLAGGKYGSALGYVVYSGNKELVTSLLDCVADPFHVGGAYETPTGEYPSALDAARSRKAGADILELLEERMNNAAAENRNSTPWPPFPMPYAGSCGAPGVNTEIPVLSDIGNLTAAQADLKCSALTEESLASALVALVGVNEDAAERLQVWIRNDVRYFIHQKYDYGLAYAAARVAWKNFNDPQFNVAAHRYHWHAQARQIDTARDTAIYTDATGQDLIKLPYQIMPRRIWDLKSNRVIEFRMLHSELLARESLAGRDGDLRPSFWAITHSWTRTMEGVKTSINQFQWLVPLPRGLDLEFDVRKELLNMGAEYVWLDVLCLRQQQQSNTKDNTREDEWKIDVPTIGNIYRAATVLVRYFNGLGQPFRSDGWDDERHWLCRAWTLQEIRPENTTINGGGITVFHGRNRANRGGARIMMNTMSTVDGTVTTMRKALQPVVKLAAQADSPGGCSVYDLVKQMAKRHATQPTDKVAGLLYLLRTTQLPTYDETVSDEDAWTRCFHVLPFPRKLEILCDYPYRGSNTEWEGSPEANDSSTANKKDKWFPGWHQLIEWPDRDPAYDHISAEWPDDQRSLQFHDQPMAQGSLLLTDIWAISKVFLSRAIEENECGENEYGENEYQVKSGDWIIDFYSPYKCQKPIEIQAPDQLFTLVTCYPDQSYNWVVCEVITEQEAMCKTADGTVKLVEFEVLRKVGVLRTDHCSEIILGVGRSDSVLNKINALFT